MPIGGQSIPLPLKALASTEITLLAGEIWTVPAGRFMVYLGPYTFLQFLNPVTQLWENDRQAHGNSPHLINSDGANWRIANISGCPVGAVVTNAGSGYTSAPTVVANAGGSSWRAIVGGLVNGTFTLPTFKGANYTYPPIIVVDAPPVGGLPCTATCAISGGALTSVTIRDQGAGYVVAPTFHFFSDPRDPNNPITNPSTTTPITPIGTVSYAFEGQQVGDLASTATLTGSGTIAAVVCTDPGNAVTSLPTLAFSGGGGSSAAATVVMNWCVTGISVTGGGAGYGTIAAGIVVGGKTAATPVNTQPSYEQNITQIRPAKLEVTTNTGAISGAGTVIDAGIGYQAVPTGVFVGGVVTTAGTATITVGGQTDVVNIISDDG